VSEGLAQGSYTLTVTALDEAYCPRYGPSAVTVRH